jgi:hypothetical protein
MKKLDHMAPGFMMCHVLPSGDHHPRDAVFQGERPVGFLPVDGDVLLPAVAGGRTHPDPEVVDGPTKTKASYRFSSETTMYQAL